VKGRGRLAGVNLNINLIFNEESLITSINDWNLTLAFDQSLI